MRWQLVADKYDIKKLFKNDVYHGKLSNPEVYQIKNKFILKAESWAGCYDVSLIDYETSDFHPFNTREEAIKAWTGRKPAGAGWNH